MADEYRVAGYVKLAKLWERNREKAILYHNEYYKKKFDLADCELVGVYIDITGNKDITGRKEMLRLIGACQTGRVNCIATQTKAYLAANTKEFCFLLMYLFSLPTCIDIVTEDESNRIDTVTNMDDQRQALYRMADDYIGLDRAGYERWKVKIENALDTL